MKKSFDISALGGSVLLNFHLQELGAHGLDLLLNGGSHIEGSDNSTHVLGLTDGGQTRNTATNDEDLGRGNLASRGDLTSEGEDPANNIDRQD